MELNPKTVLYAIGVGVICFVGWGIIIIARSFARALATAAALGSAVALEKEREQVANLKLDAEALRAGRVWRPGEP